MRLHYIFQSSLLPPPLALPSPDCIHSRLSFRRNLQEITLSPFFIWLLSSSSTTYCIHLNTLLLQWRGSNQESDAVGRVTTSPNLLIINESSRRATTEKSSLSLSLIQSYDWNKTLEAIKSTENPITVPQTAKSLGLAKEKEAHQSFDVTNGSSQPEVQSSQRVFRISFLRLG